MNLSITDPKEFLHHLTHHHDGYGAYTYFYDGVNILSRESAKKFKDELIQHIEEGNFVACITNWEDPDLLCSHTGELIPNAYDI